MEENLIYQFSNKEINELKRELEKDTSIFLAEIYGQDMPHLQDYLSGISAIFKFPIPSRSLDSYNDWMRDLDWLGKNSYVLIIYNFKSFLEQDEVMKRAVVEGFERLILPWWQEDVEKSVIEGTRKAFNVYLVD